VGALTQTQRLLPSTVLKAALDEKKQAYEVEHQKAMPRSEMMQTKETLEFDMLPKAFTVNKKRWFYIDTKNKWVVVNTAQASQASDVIAYLIKAFGSQGYTPLELNHALPELMKQWLITPDSLAFGFTLGAQCQLIRSEDDKTTYNCKDIETHHDHLCELLDQGYQVKSLELLWEDKMALQLMDNLVFKRVKCLDILNETLKDNGNLESLWAQFDGDMALLTGEMRQFMTDFSSLVEASPDEKINHVQAEVEVLEEA
jgi:recombination associated protein RdgC